MKQCAFPGLISNSAFNNSKNSISVSYQQNVFLEVSFINKIKLTISSLKT